MTKLKKTIKKISVKDFQTLEKIRLLVLILIPTLAAIFFGYKYYKLSQKKENKEIEIIIKKVSKHVVLPQNEKPTLLTITDENKLKNQPFFKNAKKGDKVLIYTKSKRLFLYRPSIDRIIEVARLKIINDYNNPKTGIQKSPSPKSSKPKIFLYNGSPKDGVTFPIKETLKSNFGDKLEIAGQAYAEKRNYPKTIVVDISKKFPEWANKLAKEFSTSVVNLPKGEKPPEDADILIIVGGR